MGSNASTSRDRQRGTVGEGTAAVTDELRSSDGPPTRVNYFDGQTLSASDFRTEQDYHRTMRYLHNRLLHGWGVVDGLEVDDSGDGTAVHVGAGLAIDRLGRELVLPERVSIDLPPGAAVDDETRWYVVATWEEIPSGPVIVGDATSFSRCIERCAISISPKAPDDEGLAVLLAELAAAAGKVLRVHTSHRRHLRMSRD
jgi:hypothetical protein